MKEYLVDYELTYHFFGQVKVTAQSAKEAKSKAEEIAASLSVVDCAKDWSIKKPNYVNCWWLKEIKGD